VDLNRNYYSLVILAYLTFYGSRDCVKLVKKHNDSLDENKEHVDPNSLTSLLKFSGFADTVHKHFQKSFPHFAGNNSILLSKFTSVRGMLYDIFGGETISEASFLMDAYRKADGEMFRFDNKDRLMSLDDEHLLGGLLEVLPSSSDAFVDLNIPRLSLPSLQSYLHSKVEEARISAGLESGLTVHHRSQVEATIPYVVNVMTFLADRRHINMSSSVIKYYS